MKRFLQTPALHWILLGGLLFVFGPPAGARQAGPPAAIREPIVITAAELARLRESYRRESGQALTPADESALLEREIRDRLLYREALSRGLARRDRSIRWRLASKMRFLAESVGEEAGADGHAEADASDAGDEEALYREALALGLDRDDLVVKRILVHKMRLLIRLQADDDVPDEETLRAFYEANAGDYTQPARVSFTQVFVGRGKHGGGGQAEARRLLDALDSRPATASDGVRIGDPFPLGHRYRSRSRADVAKVFGEELADAVMAAKPGRWSGPFASAHGWHLIWVDERRDERPPGFESVRSRVFERWVAERRDEHLDSTLARLRSEYEIRIEGAEHAGDERGREARS